MEGGLVVVLPGSPLPDGAGLTDEDLMEAHLEGTSFRDGAPFDIFVERYWKRVHSFLVTRGVYPADAEEVTNDVFIEFERSIRKVADRSSPKRLLFHIAGQRGVDAFRRRCRAQGRFTELDEKIPPPYRMRTGGRDLAEELHLHPTELRILSREVMDLVRRTLSDDEQEVLHLRREIRTDEEIAALQGSTAEAIKVKRFRIIRRLRKVCSVVVVRRAKQRS